MYFYHEGYYDAHYPGATPEVLSARNRRHDQSIFEPIQTPAILNWLAIVSVALCIIFTTIHALS